MSNGTPKRRKPAVSRYLGRTNHIWARMAARAAQCFAVGQHFTPAEIISRIATELHVDLMTARQVLAAGEGAGLFLWVGRRVSDPGWCLVDTEALQVA